jgi:hypothetical protein
MHTLGAFGNPIFQIDKVLKTYDHIGIGKTTSIKCLKYKRNDRTYNNQYAYTSKMTAIYNVSTGNDTMSYSNIKESRAWIVHVTIHRIVGLVVMT